MLKRLHLQGINVEDALMQATERLRTGGSLQSLVCPEDKILDAVTHKIQVRGR